MNTEHTESGRTFHVGDQFQAPANPAVQHNPVWTLIAITPPDAQYPGEQAALKFRSDVRPEDPIEWSVGSRDIEAYGMTLIEGSEQS